MIKVLYTYIVLFAFISCHSVIGDEFIDTKAIPVLNGYLESGKTLRVHITFSSKLSDMAPTPIENAQVIIESTTKNIDTLIYTKNGWYVSPRVVVAGETYICKVYIDGYHPITAKTTIPNPTGIGLVMYTDLAGRGTDGEKISSLEFDISNNPLKFEYWQVSLISEGIFGIEKEEIYMLAGQDTTLLNEANPLTLFSNKQIKKSTYKVKFYINEHYARLNSDETYYIELKSVDEAYYNYSKQYYIYETAFAEIGKTSQNYPLYSNTSNGLGIFCSTATVRKKLEINTTNPE